MEPVPFFNLWVRVSLVGIEILTIEARIVITSVDTFFHYAREISKIEVAEEEGNLDDLEAIQSVLAEYHYSTDWWEVERAQLETLLYEVTQVWQIASHPEAI